MQPRVMGRSVYVHECVWCRVGGLFATPGTINLYNYGYRKWLYCGWYTVEEIQGVEFRVFL
jgi:hypothetical protein